MQALILAAGKGTRIMPFTCTRPKPMISVANKSILEHNLIQLLGLVDEVIIVVGYRSDIIKNHFGDSFKGVRIRYISQKDQLGTGHAVLQAETMIKGKFIILYGDDLYHRDDIKRCIGHDFSVLAKEVFDPKRFGVFTVKGNKVVDLVEKPEKPKSNLVNTGVYVLDDNIFSILKKIDKSKRGEYEFTDAVLEISKSNDVFCEVVKKYWIPVGYPYDILLANEIKVAEVFEKSKDSSKLIDKGAIIEDGVVLKGDVAVGCGTVIKSGTYIEGPCVIGNDSKIGPNAYIRARTAIGNNCHIGAFVELKNTIVMNNSNVPHLCYIGDSVIGEHVNLGAGTIGANLRHDGTNVKLMCNGGVLIDSGRRKLGCFIADYSKTGVKTVLSPGIMIGPFSWTSSAEEVNRNLKPFEILSRGKVSAINVSRFDKLLKTKHDRKVMESLYSYVKVKY
ncbi:MAG: NTP transferase domain-containing protein [DPANN group archaeon]|nr:NTP transferase domain-containing protein [DPANN group archaeon]